MELLINRVRINRFRPVLWKKMYLLVAIQIVYKSTYVACPEKSFQKIFLGQIQHCHHIVTGQGHLLTVNEPEIIKGLVANLRMSQPNVRTA